MAAFPDPTTIAAGLHARRLDRETWHRFRAERREAWRILHDREDPDARAFLAPFHSSGARAAMVERLRARRIAALHRALKASHPAARAMELATYRVMQAHTARYLERS